MAAMRLPQHRGCHHHHQRRQRQRYRASGTTQVVPLAQGRHPQQQHQLRGETSSKAPALLLGTRHGVHGSWAVHSSSNVSSVGRGGLARCCSSSSSSVNGSEEVGVCYEDEEGRAKQLAKLEKLVKKQRKVLKRLLKDVENRQQQQEEEDMPPGVSVCVRVRADLLCVTQGL